MSFDPDCRFCQIVAGTVSAAMVDEREHTVAFLDHRPLFKGHTLVVPRRHVVTLPEADDRLMAPLMAHVRDVAAVIPEALGAQGTFVALNNVVSQSVPHLHWHVVPRTRGDGMRGFFWPRTKYASPDEMADYATRLRASISGA